MPVPAVSELPRAHRVHLPTSLAGGHVVVVLNYRGADDTRRCIDSLVAGSPEALVLLVDNGPEPTASLEGEDDVLAMASVRWPEAGRVRTGRNLGFAGGMNVGLRLALEAGAATVTVLNNDTVVPPGAMARLASAASPGRIVSPEVRYLDEPDRVWFAGGTIDRATNLARHLSPVELSDAFPGGADPRQPSIVLSGCCLTAPAEVWQHVGLFDERFFLLFEDSELSVRATRRGVPLVVDRSSVIHHRVSASFEREASWLGLYYYTRNGLLFARCIGRAGPAPAARFLRRHVMPNVLAPARAGNRRTTARRARVVGRAVTDHLLRRYGEAPTPLRRRVAEWRA